MTTETVVDFYYTGCPRRNVPDFGRVFLTLKYTDITQNNFGHMFLEVSEFRQLPHWAITPQYIRVLEHRPA
jgi:hypothetical protein